jgi:hypothetical protein
MLGVFKTITGNNSLHQNNKTGGIRKVSFAIIKVSLLGADYPEIQTFIRALGPLQMAGQLSRPDIADDTQVHFKKGN